MTKEIQKKESTEMIPSYLKQYSNEGAEDIASDIIEKSFLVVSHEEKDGLKFGEFYDSNTKQGFGTEVKVTVCKISRTWRKFNHDFQLEAQSTNGFEWDDGEPLTEEEKWQTAFIDMFVLLNDHDSNLPFILSFKSTSYKTGRKLATAIAKFTRGNNEPIFCRNYTIYTEEAKKGSKSYAVMKYKINSGFNNEDISLKAHKIRKMIDGITPIINEDIEGAHNIQANEEIKGVELD